VACPRQGRFCRPGISMNIFVVTGAGVSAESGLGTFRDKSGAGLWARSDPMKLATPEAFARDPKEVHAFYNLRRRNLLTAKPNAAHYACARLEAALDERGGTLTLVTQNIDDLSGPVRVGSSTCTANCSRLVAPPATQSVPGEATLGFRINAGNVRKLAPFAHMSFGSERRRSKWMKYMRRSTSPIFSSRSGRRVQSIPRRVLCRWRDRLAHAPARSIWNRPTTRISSMKSDMEWLGRFCLFGSTIFWRPCDACREAKRRQPAAGAPRSHLVWIAAFQVAPETIERLARSEIVNSNIRR
jgi:hypothetical protein